jgi:putative endonuclease
MQLSLTLGPHFIVHGRPCAGHPRAVVVETSFKRDLRMPGWVYIMTNQPNGTLYVGVTDDLARRAWEHRAGLVEGFTKQYGLRRLVFAEHYDDMRAARQRERNMKHWRRSWKVRLILDQNPDWGDLYDRLS